MAKKKMILPYYMQPVNRRHDSIEGKFLRFSPEDCNFSSEGENRGWILSDRYKKDELVKRLNPAIDALERARTYARVNGEGNWYLLLNAVIGELCDRIN